LLFAGGDIVPVEAPVVEEVFSWAFEFSPYLTMSSISGDSAVISENLSAGIYFVLWIDLREIICYDKISGIKDLSL